ncbi:MAG TPA: TolC family protein, partial [Candidatus Limnocylindrales bacterium]|nr:TolC family protein [Candidatus Limnocylindrales bacterium]
MAAGLRAQTPTPLAQLLAEAERNNPEISAAQHVWRAATHSRAQVTALPDPQFTLQQFSVGSPRPFAGFNSSNFAYVGIGASQELPYPGKLGLKGQAADRAADVEHAQIGVVRASIAQQVKLAYVRLASLQRTLKLFEDSRATLGQMIETELSRYSTGQGNQADVLKAQLERTRLLTEITARREDVAQAQADLKQALHRPQDSEDIVAEDLRPTTLGYDSRELLELARKQNPEVQVDLNAIEKQKAEVQSAARAGKPDFSIGYMYQRTGDDFPAYYMLTFNLILPRRHRVSAQIEQAAESVKSAQARLDARLQQQLASVQKEFAAATSTADLMADYNQGVIPQAEAGFHAVLTEYASG